MKKYSQAEFNQFQRGMDGYIHCPSGDYTEIKNFPAKCRFDEFCRFGYNCIFGEYCIFSRGCCFKDRCRFGEFCQFSRLCTFEAQCTFGIYCGFEKQCSFDDNCIFGEECKFGGECKFGCWCGFGESCKFEEYCVCEFGPFAKMLSFGGFGSVERTTYAFILTDGTVSIRCGCFAGTIEKWEQTVKETHGDSVYARSYLALIPAIKIIAEGCGNENR